MSADTDRPKILFVEDETAVREHIASTLADEFLIATARDGIEALRILLRERPDVIATDIVMPELDGLEFLKTVRSTPSLRLIPILLISGRAPESLRVEGFEHGADGYLAKPYTERELRARLRTMVHTARERAVASRQEALEQAERVAVAERASLLESITDPFYALDRNFCFTYLNQRAIDYFGKSRDELLGQNIWKLFPQALGSSFESEYRRALRQLQPSDFEEFSPVTQRWVEVHVYPTPRGLAINFRDITARKEFERALRQSESARTAIEAKQREAAARDAARVRLNDALRPLGDPAQIKTTASQILGEHLKVRGVAYLGVTGPEQTVDAEFLADDMDGIGRWRLGDVDSAILTRVRDGQTLAIDDVSQDERLAETTRAHALACGLAAHAWAPVMQEQTVTAVLVVHESRPRRWSAEEIGLIQEFADRVGAALDRVRQEIHIREANRRKDEFLATLAHELRNPLAPMRSAVHVLDQPNLSEAHARRAREIMSRQIHHMVRLVDDLLDVSRINVGQVNLRHEVVSLRSILLDAVEAARTTIDEAEHRLELQLPDDTVRVEGDPTRLVQVFQNLLTNAAKYTPAGGRIAVETALGESQAAISVRDNGFGIAPEAQARVFELFTRLHPLDSIKVSGLGIGLALARTLVELHSGRIEVHSAGVGQGSEFKVYLPVATSLATAEAVSALPSIPPRREHRVLVVDDNRDAADSLALLLRGDGFETRVAFDGPGALEEFARYSPDLILLDIGMPVMDGYEVARQIRLHPQGNIVVLCALTGWGQPRDKQRAFEAGFDEHFTKPVDPNSLGDLLISAIRRRHAD